MTFFSIITGTAISTFLKGRETFTNFEFDYMNVHYGCNILGTFQTNTTEKMFTSIFELSSCRLIDGPNILLFVIDQLLFLSFYACIFRALYVQYNKL